ncbi:hypothetical protein [Flavivirga algicola]|uniref:Diacylglycerol glucosyltransferase N-terminal domain-containing protein n=1 Tax=Flavivirga algicola TaxID=2729136 RepID=A0ABX1RS19_9FLAO|nr:hypothetical protein [Flavivirga algicola]NMH86342.1 hypothetical protein [Flavivirga algicola]
MNNKRKKVIFVVPDGTGIRNYLFSEIIPNLIKQDADLVVYHALSNEAITEVEKLHGIRLTKKNIPKYEETVLQKLLRESICYGRLIYNTELENNPTVLTNWKPKRKGLQKWFYKVAEFLGNRISKDYKNILRFENYYQKKLLKSISVEKEFLQDIQPDVIFCTHQRALNAIPIFKAAEMLNIETIGAIYSWDNLVKARLSVRTKKYIVWSDYMKVDMKKYYPEILEDNIIVTGTPQFELYQDSLLLSKENFFNDYGLDISKPTICFSGDDELTSPYDPLYLEDFVDAIIKDNLQDKVQVIFRRSPVDLSGRYDAVIDNFDFITSIEPAWSNNQKAWTQLFPYYDDVKLLANICKHCSLVVNLGSTMAHDFAIFDNPAAYLNYNTTEDENWSVNTIYNYQHFKSMPHKDVVYWINSKEDFITVLDQALSQKKSLGKDWLKIINTPNKVSTKTIANLLLQ